MKKLMGRIMAMTIILAMVIVNNPFIPSVAYAAGTYYTIPANGRNVKVSKDDPVGYQGGDQCWKYSKKVYEKIWGCTIDDLKYFNKPENMLRKLNDDERKITEENTKNFITAAPLGSNIRISNARKDSDPKHFDHDGLAYDSGAAIYLSNGKKKTGHNIILVAKSSTGFTYIENISSGTRERTQTWKAFADDYGSRYVYFKYIKYPQATEYVPFKLTDTGRFFCRAKKNISLYDAPKNDAKPVESVLKENGIITIGTHTSKEGKWYKTDGNQWVKAGDVTTPVSAPSKRNPGKETAEGLKIKVAIKNKSTWLEAEPYSTYESSSNYKGMVLAKKGEQFTTVNLWKNQYNNYWLELENGLFICANNVYQVNDSQIKDVTIEGYVAPKGDLKYGSGFDIKGTVKSSYKILKVTGGVYDPSQMQGYFFKPIVEKSVNVNGYSLNLYNSNINVASRGGINFGKLATGSYIFLIQVEYEKKVWKDITNEKDQPYTIEKITYIPEPATSFTVGQGKNSEAALAKIAEAVAATAITLSSNTANLMIGDTYSLSTTISPAIAAAARVSWSSSNPAVATVTRGLITAVGKGTATITAVVEDGSNKTATCTVTVGTLPETITISGTKDLYLNDNNNITVQLIASVNPADADDTSVTWSSSDTSVATVSSAGLVTAKKAGSTVIMAKANGNSSVVAQATIRVRNWVSGITLSGDSRVAIGAKKKIEVAIVPQNADNSNLTWGSSDSTIASVSSDGQVTGKKTGTVTITATAADRGTVAAQKEIEIYQPVKDINITGEHELVIGTQTRLTASVLPADADITTLMWESGNTQTATVDQNGNVTATGNGTVDITVKSRDDSSVQATHRILVKTLVSDITLEATEDIPVGTIGQIESTVSPATASKQALRWESEDPGIAAVDGNGQVTGINAGTTTITAKATDGSGVSQSVVVSIYKQVQRVSIDVDTAARTGETLYPTIIMYPEDARKTNTEFTSSDENVIRVVEVEETDGIKERFICVGPGVAKITATSTDGSNVSGSAYITVKSNTELMNHEMTYDLLTTGSSSGELDSVALTTEAAALAAEGGYGAKWTIEHISGDNAAEIGMTEEQYTFKGFSIVHAVQMKLLGINGSGSDVYRVTCTINGFSDSCTVTVNVTAPEKPLPTSLSLSQNSFQGRIGEAVVVDTTPVCEPASSDLPQQTGRSIRGDSLFSRFATVTEAGNNFSVGFTRAGTYTAEVKFTGANYDYTAPVTFTITNPDGTVPASIQEIGFEESILYLLTGETKQIQARIAPAEADESTLAWSSSDSSVATVSNNGTVTAAAEGTAIITASAGTAVSARAIIRVTDSLLSIDWNEEDPIRVYVEGEKGVSVQKIFLTSRASASLTEAPEWTLKRTDGRNLTLTTRPVKTTEGNGQTLYGCEIILKSASTIGTTTYELTCSDGNNSTSVTLTAEAMHAKNAVPEMVHWPNRVFSGKASQLIKVTPVAEYWPGSVGMPAEAMISIEGDDYWNEALNLNDYTVSRNQMTFSFNTPGVYKAKVIYSCSNMRYSVPIEMRIADADGNVPVRAEKLTLNNEEFSVNVGATAQIKAIFAPTDATNKTVSWSSEDSSIATVDANGLITGVSLGRTRIHCIPADENCLEAVCEVAVENDFTILQYEEMSTQYLKGSTGMAAAGFSLSKGTAKRLEDAGIKAVWTLNRKSGQAADVSLKERDGVQYIEVTKLNAAGTDVYEVTCTAGSSYSWSGETMLTVIDSDTIPAEVMLAQTAYTAEIGEEIMLDFTPQCAPGGTTIPAGMRKQYVGIGDFYSALDSGYRPGIMTEQGNQVTAVFRKRGTYILSRKYNDRNLTFVTQCLITVDGGTTKLLTCDNPEAVVYVGGQSSIAATCIVKDTSIPELYGNEMTWKAERLSGNCLTVALKADANGAALYVVNAKEEGSERWRVSCGFAGITESIDVTIDAVQTADDLPTTAELYKNRFEGMIGQEVRVPLSVTCAPEGAKLPSKDSSAWRFITDGNGEDHAKWEISDSEMKITFSESGYYGGKLEYQSGNVKFAFPVTFAVTDEEGVLSDPERVNLDLSKDTVTVYPEGETHVSIVNALLSDSLDEYSLDSITAFAEQRNAEWTLTVKSGNACTLALEDVSASAKKVVLESITGTGDVVYEVKCTIDGKTYKKEGTVHVADENEDRPQAEIKKDYYVTPTGTVLTIDASFYDRNNGLKLCSGWDSVWGNDSVLAAIGFDYNKDGDYWLPVFYEPGGYQTTVSSMIGNLRFENELTIAAYTERPLPDNPKILTFPTALTQIEDEAFTGTDANVIDLRETHISSIGEKAFAEMDELMVVYLPGNVKSIDNSAFSGCKDFIIICADGTYAEEWAQSNGYPAIPEMN